MEKKVASFMSRHSQRCLTDFFNGLSATSSSREGKDEAVATCLSSDANDDDQAIAEIEKESSESETGQDDDTGCLLMLKRRKSLGSRDAGKHRKSWFDPGWTQELKWLDKVEIEG